MLLHLEEEIDYLELTNNPGVLAFVDFEKAYDRISRPWVLTCMERLGFGPVAMRWVRLLLEGTQAMCCYNGPARTLLHLPHELWGRAVPCLRRAVDSLQAGVLCRLLDPCPAPWKVWGAYWFQRLPPPLAGLRSIIYAGEGGPRQHLPPRVAGYLDGLHACEPHRACPLANLPAPLLLAEPLFGNPSILDAGGALLVRGAFPASVAAGVCLVGGLLQALMQPPAPLEADLTALRGSLPAGFFGPSPPQVHDEWWLWPPSRAGDASVPGQVLRRHAAGAGCDVATAYAAGCDGRLVEVQGGCLAPADRPVGPWCLVIDLSPPPAPDASQQPPQLYLVGRWGEAGGAPLDPTRWGLGGAPLFGSTARLRTRRLMQRAAERSADTSVQDFSPGQPLRPRVWPGPEGCMSDLERREQQWVEAAAPVTGQRRQREVTQAADSHIALSTAWMRESGARLHPVVRQQLLQEQPNDAEEEQGTQGQGDRSVWAAFDSAALQGPTAVRLPWGSTWRRLRRVPAPCVHRFRR